MTNATISFLKNHLPEIVHTVEKGHDIQITRHGNPVAVIISLEKYNKSFSATKGIYNAFQRWRNIYPEANGFSDKELEAMQTKDAYKETSTNPWD